VDEFGKALEIVAEIMRLGAKTHYEGEWMERAAEFHIGRAEEHIKLLRDGDQRQDHLAHATTRLLLALAVRELG
jgi:dATP/dGTP diphosphohydrolase, N-terminal